MTPETRALREACRDRCASYGEPPCWEFDDASAWHTSDWCKECRADAKITIVEPLDPDAVVAPLL